MLNPYSWIPRYVWSLFLDPEVYLIPILGSRGVFNPYSWYLMYFWSIFLVFKVWLIPFLESPGIFDPCSWIPRYIWSLFLDPELCWIPILESRGMFDPYSWIQRYVWSLFLDPEVCLIPILSLLIAVLYIFLKKTITPPPFKIICFLEFGWVCAEIGINSLIFGEQTIKYKKWKRKLPFLKINQI